MSTEARKWGDKEATVYIGNLDEKMSDALVYELCLQVGRVVSVHLPRDRVSQTHQGYGFVDFREETDAEYACKILHGVKLYGKAIRMNKATADKNKTIDVGAELFVGNLDPFVTEEALFQTFNKFGDIVATPKVHDPNSPETEDSKPTNFRRRIKIARDADGNSKGYGFVNFTDFEAADKAIEAMNNQFLFNRTITVQYAYKKDGKGERHGDEAERALAREARQHGVTLDAWKPEMAAANARPMAAQSAGPPISLTANGYASQPEQFNQPPLGQFMPPQSQAPQGFGQFPPQQVYGKTFPPQPPMQMPPQPFNYGYPPAPNGPPAYGMQQAPPGFGAPPNQAPPGFGAPPAHGPSPGQAPPGFNQAPPGFGNPPGFPPQQNYGRR